MNTATDDVVVRTRTLERMLLNSMMRVKLDVNEPRVSVTVTHECDALVARLQAYVWAEEIQNDTATLTVEWPASPWQAFKDRWFPRWALRRWPVKLASRTESFKFTVKAKLPEYRYIAPPNMGPYALHAEINGAARRFRGDRKQDDDE